MTRFLIAVPTLFFLLILFAHAVPADTYAQNADQPPTLTEHLKTELQTKSVIRRHQALLDAVALANCPDNCQLTLNSVQDQRLRTKERVELTSLTPELLSIYRRGPEDGYRLLALSALIGIGSEEALSTLIDEERSQSNRVNQETQRSLAGFYLEKYPELANKATWTGEITLEDVERVKRVRFKKTKKN